MNRIYNVIWSKTKKCYVVVSEIVKSSGGKVKSLHTGKTYTHMSTVMAVAALLAGVNITSVNAAAIMIDGVNAGYATAQNGGNKWSYLYNYNNPGNMNALDGSATTGYYSGSALNGISIGHNTKIQESSDPTYYSGVAIGDYAQATGGLSFSLGNYAQSTKPSAMAIGTASLSSGFNSLAMMRQSAATGNFSTAIGTTSWASGTGSFALGYSAQSKGDQSIAIGAAEPITVAGSGNEPSAAYNGTTNTVTEGARSLAFGTKARTTAAATDSMAFGSNAKTKAANAVAMGNSSRATGTDSFAFGNTASAAGTNAIAMGRTAQASKANAIALGGQAKALEANALAIGSTAEASKAGTMAIGTASKASSNNSTAIGNGAEVTGENSMALGSGAKISSNNSIALGAGTEFNDPLVSTYAAFTNEMNPAEAGVVAVGNSSTPRRIVNVAGGQNDNDAATIKQLRYVNNNLAMTIAGPTYTGYEANGSTYKAPDFNIKNSTYHTVKEAVEAAQTNFFSAKGTSADANYDNKGATGTNATAAGVRASAAGNFGTALGADATATSEKGTALGYNAKVTEDDGVALGSNSVANTAAGVAGYDVSVADNRANRYTDLTGSVAISTLGAVSVGQSTSVGTETRQITNLAAGKKDTDAVNVAQLRNVNLKIAGNTNDNNGKNDVLLDKQTLTVKGDGTYVTTKANNQTIDVTLTNDTKDKIDNAANKDLSNITNVGKKNITALGTIVEAGNNVTIPAATVDTTTGQKTYTVNAMDTKVSLGTSGLMTLTGGTPDVNGVRNYTVDVDPTKVAKTDLSNINNDGKTVIREEAQKAVKVIAGQNTTVTEGTDGTYKTYAVNVAAAGDYRLVENSAAADKAYTVTGNKVDLTVQDGSTPANTKTVTIKDIASKTELDSTKSDLTTKITDTKTELINKGLKFNADNNDVKTNKLGSTVTVSGDANITTKITQTGDDSTIAVALNKDLNVKTVTATDTVKVGTTTAGSQTATDNKGGTQTGNFVTGLDNTTWNMADPVFVSGRAATEDQLKKVSDAVRAANAGSSDYRLIENDAATDKAYTVTGNKVDLKVKDDKSGTTNTVTIKDIASKTEFDKLNDRAVKYDVDGSGNVDKSKVTYEGPTYNSTNKSGGTHVTNVAYATGNDGSEAVNVDYLTDKIKDSSDALINKGLKFDANVGGVQTNKLGSTVTVQGEGAEADANYSGKNIKTFIKQDTAGNTTIDVKMNKNLEVETVTATGANGKDGKIGINGKDGVTTNLSITRDGKPGVDGVAGATTTRIVYEKPDGTTEEVATLNDGLRFKGDMGATSNVKLNKQVDVTGGVTNAADLATGNNIGVTSAAVDANGNAKLQLQLAKDITGLKSVTATDTVKAGTATVGNQTATDNKGGTQTGNFVTGLDNTNWNMTDPVFVPGRAATEDQLKTVSDAVKAASASSSDYRLIENDAATDKAYTVTGNKVDLTVQDGSTPANTKTVTIKDIASKTELDSTKSELTTKINDTKTELSNKIDDTKTDLINTGLKFDADNNDVKTNKLGSKVTVAGDANITTKITQTGDDSTIVVTLNKDLNVNTVTATNTVKAGTATMGNQSATDNKGATQTGNFVTGLDNTAWNMANPVFVSGRAATEDQLKTVSDAVRAANAGSSDYRLIENDTATDKAYTVTSNKVDLKVKDDKSGTTKTVTIKDIASKTELDKLDDRAVKYDLDPATNTADKSKVTYEGPTYNSTNKTGGTHVTNVAYATGNDGSEAVNVDYLTDKIKDSSDALINKGLKFDANVGGVQTNKLGSTVTVKGEGTAADANYSGENIKTFIEQDTAGNTTINVKMNKDIIADSIKVNKDGRDGKDGVSITGPIGVAGQDGNNGKVGITGADGKDAVSISGKDGVGHIGLTGPAGTNGKDGSNGIDMSVKNGYDDAAKGVKGEKGVDGVDGITRIVYTDNTGEHQVATMDDGMLYGGDAGNVIKKKLNNQVNVKGGITDETKLTADDNIGVVSDGTDTLKVRLAKDLKGLNTVTAAKTVKAGTATVGNQEATKADGTKETGNYVTGLDNKTWDVDNIVTGRAATEDQLKDALANQSNAGLKFDANVGGTKTNKLGSTVIVKGEGTDADANYSGENIKTFIKQDTTTGNTTIDVKLNKNLVADSIKINKDGKDGKDGVSITGPTGVAGQDGNNGKVGITGADGKDAVSISGKDGVGHIGLTGPAGTNGINGTNGIDMSVKNGYDDAAKGVKGEKGVDGVDGITRIVYTDNTGEHQVATMDDGMLYGGDTGTVIKKKLNNQVNVKGGITDAAKLSNEDNIGVVADGTDTLMLRLAKDLKGLNSATFNNGTDGNTVVNGGGLTINDAAGNPLTSVTKDGVTITDGPSMTKDGIDASDKKITNVADGTIGAGSKDAVNGGQLHTVVEDLKTKGFGLTAEDGASVKKSLGDTVTVKGDGTNITTSVDNGAVKVALAKDLNVDTVTANTVTTGDTKMDTNGVTIKDGANEATKLTKDGLQINDGGNKAVTIDKDGLTIENGPKVTKDGINAGDKKITNVEDGTIAAGSKDAVNGGQLHTAMEDIKAQGFGLKAEDGQSVKKPLGEVIDLKGDGNIKTSVDGTAIKMSLNDTITLGTDPAKQVKVDGSTGTITAGNGANQVTIDGSTGSVTAGNTVKAGDVIMGNQNSGGQNGNFVAGLDNKTWNPNNPVAVTGRAATEDQLKAVNDDFNEKAKNGRVFQGDQAGNDGKVVRGLGDTMNLKGGADVNRLSDNNLAVVKNAAGDGYDIKLAKDLNLKDGSTTYTKTVPGTNTTIPYTVDTKVDGGGITITPSINGQPVPGHTVSLTENGLNNGNNTITNVAPGINGTDAVNVNQLRNAMHSVDGKIADVGAASAAMAGLKPLQYDPLEPTQVLAAVGNYKGSTAAAIGIAHYTNESTMLHMGVSLGGHDNMVNAGVSYKFGTSDAKKAIPARYKAGPISSAYVMQDEVTALKAENLRMKQRDEELSAKYEQVQRDNEEMKAQIAMLMKQAGLTK